MNIKKGLAAMAVATATATSFATPAQAEVPAPIAQWEQDVVTVYARNMGPSWQVDESIVAWNEAGVVQLVRVYDPAQANIKLNRSTTLPPDYQGIALYDFTKTEDQRSFTGYFAWCKVMVKKDTPKWMKADLLQHEMGHCLGLLDNYATPEDVSIMSYDDLFSKVAPLSGPTILDYETLQYYYSHDAAYWEASIQLPPEEITP